ncbi:MAG: hypothetical protein R2729_05115 [Bryobacteraceae bacterium]
MKSATPSVLAHLERAQNPDGGWGYRVGGASWMEPTFWAWVALRGHADRAVGDRAWVYMRTLRREDGGVAPAASVRASSWVTSLWITAHVVAGKWDPEAEAALDWLLKARGAEGKAWRRAVERIRGKAGYDPEFYGWSWFPETSSWLEPTAHALVALKLAAAGPVRRRAEEIGERVRLGERMLLDRRCEDGAWNYGARIALDEPLPSYPECTGQALYALQRRWEITPALLDGFRERWNAARSPMARAWLALGFRLNGAAPPEWPAGVDAGSRDTSVRAIAAIAAAGGNFGLLAPGGRKDG